MILGDTEQSGGEFKGQARSKSYAAAIIYARLMLADI
jgi:hypothetical protein